MKPRSVLFGALRAALVVAILALSGPGSAQDRELHDSPDFRVRVQAALRLGRAGGAQARGDLEHGLHDAHPAVRVACAVGLGSLGDPASIPALERAIKSESIATVKTAMKDTVDKLRGAKAAGAGTDPAVAVDRAKYVVQLGSMRNVSGVRSSDLDAVMRQAARARAQTIKGAVVLDGADPAVLKKAQGRHIPVLLVDGSLTRLTQTTSRDGGVIVSAKVDMSIRRVPQQTLKGMVSGNASGSNDSRVTPQNLAELQNRVVGGAVESALNSMSAEIASLAK